jgi:glycosyltransferase involved in cell wall biosynthesis
MIAAAITRTPCITHERSLDPPRGRLTRFLAGRLRAIICVSRAVEDHLKRHGIPDRLLHVIYNGIDPTAVEPRRSGKEVWRGLGRSDRLGPIVVMVGNIRRWKGQTTLVRAMTLVRRTYPDAQCLLVGATSARDRRYADDLGRLVCELGLESSVHLLGFQHGPDFMNIAHVVVHASVEPEPFGRVLLEAMALKKPIVGADGGAVPEIVQDGVTGRLVPAGDHVALAEAIKDVLADRPRALRMADRGYDRVWADFHIARTAAKTVALYEHVLGAPTSGSGVACHPVRVGSGQAEGMRTPTPPTADSRSGTREPRSRHA